ERGKKRGPYPLPGNHGPANFPQPWPQRTYRRHSRVSVSLATLHRGLPPAQRGSRDRAHLPRSPRLAVADASRRLSLEAGKHQSEKPWTEVTFFLDRNELENGADKLHEPLKSSASISQSLGTNPNGGRLGSHKWLVC